jgi:radical SAM superfamily enzyme YgiQ (UPF0313 family)
MPKPDHPSSIIKDITHKDLLGLNVVFINMPLRETAPPNTTPEGPLLMATRLIKEYGVNATIIDLNGYRIKDALANSRGLTNGRHLTENEVEILVERHCLVHGEPALVAISGMITTLRWQKIVSRIIRKKFPGTFIVSGGGLATELGLGLFKYVPDLDGVAHSEGDDVVIKIALDAKSIKTLGAETALGYGLLRPYYIGRINGRHSFLYAGDRPLDLDALPIADLDLIKKDVFGYEMLEYYLRNAVWGLGANNSSATSFSMTRSTTSVSSRGCPFDCAFCFRKAQGERNWGIRSALNIAKQIETHRDKHGIDFFGMPDDNFAVNPKRILDMVDCVGSLGIPWGTHTRLDEAADIKPGKYGLGDHGYANPKRIDLMARSGCIYVGFGAESASPRVLTSMMKGGQILSNGIERVNIDGQQYEFPRTMVDGIKNCQTAGIHANCTWIMAYPSETIEDLKTSVAFMLWQERFYSQFGKSSDSVNKRMFVATWYPGTEMSRNPKVMLMLNSVFGIKFDPRTKEPICDESFERYILELDDATKMMQNPVTGQPLNYSDMPTDIFTRAKDLIDSGKTLDILEI